MVVIRCATAVQARRRCARLALTVALLATLAGCTTYVFIPVDVTYEKVSPPYVVSVVNETGSAFDVYPTRAGTSAGYAAGDTFKAVLQLRRFTVGAGSAVRGAQVLDNPYFEQAGADKVEMRLVQGDPYSIFIAIQDPSWFDEYTMPAASPMELVVRLREISRIPLYPRGPKGGP
jgi:hypothetical protein